MSVGVGLEGLELSFHHFQRAMGIAVRENQLAVGTQTAIWFLHRDDELAGRFQPAGRYDSCFLARSARFTGEILSHELAWSGDELWVVNTRFSCLCTFDDRHSFVPRWRPKFITGLAAEDRCHLNGLALADGRPKFVTALGRDRRRGGLAAEQGDKRLSDRPGQRGNGDQGTGDATLAAHPRGASLAPRFGHEAGWLWQTWPRVRSRPWPNYPATPAVLPCSDPWHSSVSRNSERRTPDIERGAHRRIVDEPLKCGVAVVDLASGRQVALLEFQSGIEEVFDVQVLPGVRSPLISGPNPQIDSRAVWFVP